MAKSKFFRRCAGNMILLTALIFCACTQVPEYCDGWSGKFNAQKQFCFDGVAYDKCGGADFDPTSQQCDGGKIAQKSPPAPPVTPVTKYKVKVSAGSGATGDGSYAQGERVYISAGTPPTGQQFKIWTTSSSGVVFASARSSETSFFMPANAVTVTAEFEDQGTPIPTTYLVVVSSTGGGATGGGNYAKGDTVRINAGPAPINQNFKNWTSSSSGVTFADKNSEATTFVMPGNKVTVTANFEPQGGVTPTKYQVTVTTAGTDAFGTGSYAAGEVVTIYAGTAPSGQRFKGWTAGSSGVVFEDEGSETTTFSMPGHAVTVRAVFEAVYKVTVSSAGAGATGGGSYAEGATVSINAGTARSDQRFKNWTSASNGVDFVNANSIATTFTMPANAVTVTANFDTVFTDSRDGKVYKKVTIGGRTWMGENLNYETKEGEGNSWCYNNEPEKCEKYGRLYDWYTAVGDTMGSSSVPSGVKGVCPNGWHLPSRQEWIYLAVSAGGTGTSGKEGTAGMKLKSTSGWNTNGNGTDDFGFSALPGGIYYNTFEYVGDYGFWWTATKSNNLYANAYSRSMGYVNAMGENDSYWWGSGLSVRCLEN